MMHSGLIVFLAESGGALKTWGAGHQTHYSGPLHCLRDIWKTRGIRGCYRGSGAMIFRYCTKEKKNFCSLFLWIA